MVAERGTVNGLQRKCLVQQQWSRTVQKLSDLPVTCKFGCTYMGLSDLHILDVA